ncbi:aspartate/glutamate racemase family protein [Aureimonas sp. AU20]|nr:aspartate/glutamate racemase family protein [Aureimonas sp. AU20]ALN72219.1 hypothetical protein M673_05795 [Aureimonas sp. AU20]
MHLCFINPNSTAGMTGKIAEAARAAARPDTAITALTNADGPPSIQGPADGALAEPGLLHLIERYSEDFDAFVIACFDDTGLAEARRVTQKPVIGIGEAAYRQAVRARLRFSVVTTLSISVPILEENIEAYGFAPFCAKVRASEVPVLDLEQPGSAARERVAAEIAAALSEDRPNAIVLGCAGMADLAELFSARFGLPVFDGVAAAVAELEALGAAAEAQARA